MHIEKEITKEFIFSKISDLDIYTFYMPWQFQLNKNCANPFVLKDNFPSFRIRFMDGKCFHKAYNSPEKGGAIDFVQQYFRIGYKEAIEKIALDFGLKEGNSKTYEVIKSLPKVKLEEVKPVKIVAESKKFCTEHLDFLSKRGLTKDDLNIYSDTEVLPLKKFWINGDPIVLKKGEVGFIYHVKSIDKIKVYLPSRQRGMKFYSSIPFDYLHGLEDISNCDTVIVGKAIKENWILKKYLNLCTVTCQAENPEVFSEENIKKLNENAKNIFISWDADDPGVKNCIKATEKTNWKYINVPKHLNCSDWDEVYTQYGIEPIRNHFIEKKIIKQ